MRLLTKFQALFFWIIICGCAFVIAAPARGISFRLQYSIPASYPEGPVKIRDRIYVAEMTANRVIELQQTTKKTFWEETGCGPTAIAELSEGRMVVLCHLGGYLAIVSEAGRTTERILNDESGIRIRFPNDCISDGNGGVYISDAGLFAPGERGDGSILFLSKDSKVTRIARGINYANGVAIHGPTQTLYVSEHIGGRILSYPIRSPGVLGTMQVVLSKRNLIETLGELEDLVGPDGIEFFDDESFFVAIYGRGVVLRVSTSGAIREVLSVGIRYVTNVHLSGNVLVVTGAFTNTVPPFAGLIEIYAIH